MFTLSRIQKYQLSASLVCANPLNLRNDLDILIKSKIDSLHFDVMDGVFVPRYGMYPEILKSIRTFSDIPIDVHLMTINPEIYIPTFAEAGASVLTVHAEACPHLFRTISLIKKYGTKVGIALNPSTPLNVLDYVLDDIDWILLMAINPGILGQKMWKPILNKISELRQRLGEKYKHVLIQIDGGVSFETAIPMLEAGANVLVCGSSTIFKDDKPIQESILELRKKIDDHGQINR